MSKRGARMSSSSLVNDRLVSLPFRNSSYVRTSQNCGDTASSGIARSSGSSQNAFFIEICLRKRIQKPEARIQNGETCSHSYLPRLTPAVSLSLLHPELYRTLPLDHESGF